MKNKFYNFYKASFFFVLILLVTTEAFSQPASCTAAIGTPANGLQHHITITWSSVGGATSYRLDYSTDNVTWNNALDSSAATTYDHDASNTGNVPFYYRASSFTGGTQSAYTYSTPFPIYTACDYPSTPLVTNPGATTVNVQLVPESPTPNAAGTTYAIYCTTTGQYVQANGSLGATAVWQSMAAWGTVTVTGLTTGDNYCFYAEAMNQNGDIRISTTTLVTQTFDASSSIKIQGSTAPTTIWWSPSTTTSGTIFSWMSTGGCSGGTGGGNVGFSGSFNNYFGDFIRTPGINCTGQTLVTMTVDISNSYIASHGSNDYIRFYMADAAFTVGYNFATSVDGTAGYILPFSVARNCQLITVVFDLTPYANKSAMLFYVEADCGYNDSYTYSVNIDNITLLGAAPTACATTTACTAATILSNPGNQTICANNNTSFTITTGGTVASYQWQVSTNSGSTWTNVSNGGVYSNATTATLNITNATAGMNGYEYRNSVTGSCGGTPVSTSAMLTVNSVPGAAGTITGSATVCQGQNGVAYSITGVSGATGYNWSLPTGATIATGSNTNSITVNYSGSAASGNVDVTPTNTCGSGTAATSLAVTINQIPVMPGAITANASPCSVTSQNYSVASVNGATTYTWMLPGGWSGSSTTNSITVTTGSNGGTISVTADNTCGNSAARTLPVTITAIPATPGAISGANPACVASTSTYSIVPVNGATTYTWTLPGGWTGFSTADSISATAGSTGGTISVTANNTCGNSTAKTLALTVIPSLSVPGPITGSDTVCSGTPQTYSVATVSGASTYTWTLPGGWSGSSTTNSINTTVGSSSGTISVTANSSCGSSVAQTMSVVVHTVPATPSTITGPSLICSGNSGTYSVAPVANVNSYTWTIPSGWTGSSTTDSINVTSNSTSGSISVSANNTCGASTAQTLNVTSAALPQVNVMATDSTICSSDSTLVCVSSNLFSYVWNTGQTTTCIYAKLAGAYYVTITDNNNCTATSPHFTISVYPVPSVSIIVNGDTLSTFGAASYQWYYDGHSLAGANSQVFIADSTGTYTVQITDTNGCTTLSTPVFITITGIVDLQQAKVEVYPNPLSGGNWQLIVDNNLIGSGLEIFDAEGRVVYQSQIRDERSEIPLNVSSGIYLLNIISGNKIVAVKKLVKVE